MKKTIIIKINALLTDEAKEKQEKELSEKLKMNVVLLDSKYEEYTIL